MTGRQCFHRCQSVCRWGIHQSQVLSLVSGPKSSPRGYPSPWFFSWSLVPGPFLGSTSILARVVAQSWMGVISQSQPGGYPGSGRGTPVLAGGTPRQGYLPLARTGLGYSPSQDRTGVPPEPGQDLGTSSPWPGQDSRGVLPDQDSRVSTCYVAVRIPLAVTEEDFLVQYGLLFTAWLTGITKFRLQRAES